MRRTLLLLPLVVLGLLVLLVPGSAHASLKIAGGKARRETPPRAGFNVGVSVRPGVVGIGQTFVPAVRGQYEIGGGISDRLTLGVAIGGTGYLGMGKGSFNADLVVHRFFGRGFYLRGALGVVSHAPAMASVELDPAVGGNAGLGYEFRLFEKMSLGLGADYDLRVRTDGRLSQAWFLGLRFTAYLNKK